MKKALFALIAALILLSAQMVPAAAAEPAGIGSAEGTMLLEEDLMNFAGGHGTAESPYLIASTAHLDNVRLYPDAHFRLTTDILFTAEDFASGGTFYHDGMGWAAIGDWDTPFTGVFDGGNHTISGLYQSPETFGGLFGFVSDATIKDLGIVDVYISDELEYGPSVSTRAMGAIAGEAQNSVLITGCFATGRVLGSEVTGNVGGIVGSMEGSTVTGCHSACAVSGFYAGGIVSYTLNSQISNCYNAGPITSDMGSGGIVAFAQNGISDCFNAGSINGNNTYQVGGIAGVAFGNITNCYNVGPVSGGNAILGDSHDGLYNCYYLTGSGAGGGTVCTVQQMQRQSTFSGFDFAGTWVMDGAANYPYPRLRATEASFIPPTSGITLLSLPEKTVYQLGESLDLTGLVVAQTCFSGSDAVVTDYSVECESFSSVGTKTVTVHYNGYSAAFQVQVREFAGGSGTESDPYLIATATQLRRVRYHLDAHFLLTSDISLSGSSWSSIGTYSAPFTGVFDGGSHTISGLYQNISTSASTCYEGLFGVISGAQIKDLTLADVSITVTTNYWLSYPVVGGIAGSAVDSIISDCLCSGTISGLDSSGNTNGTIGGLAGKASSTTVSRCVNSADIKGCDAGGITGEHGTIIDCYNTGSITSTYSSRSSSTMAYVGGITGSYASVFRCYNSGSIAVTLSAQDPYAYVGGIAGTNSDITDCFNTGALRVSVTTVSEYPARAYTGGIAGDISSSAITNCYNTGAVSVWSKADSDVLYSGGIVGRLGSAASLSGCYYLDNLPAGVGSGTDTTAGCTIDQLRQADTFAGFDFTNTWTMAGNEDYRSPELQGVPLLFTKSVVSLSITQRPVREYYAVGDTLDSTGLVVTALYDNGISADVSGYDLTCDLSTVGEKTVTVTYGGQSASFTVCVEGSDFAGGAGTENYPYLIATAQQLDNVRNFPRSYYRLIEDIVFTETDFSVSGDFYNNGEGWIPIKINNGTVYFDGNGHTISGLYVNTTSSYAGLFGYVGGTISDLHLVNVSVTASQHAGGIVGGGSVSITGCSTSGTVTVENGGAYDAYAGGIIGYASYGSITDCRSACTVSAAGDYAHAGGISGFSSKNSACTDCVNTGAVSADATYRQAYAGGIVAEGGTITRCINTGRITAYLHGNSYCYAYAGGIAGMGNTVTACVNTGTVTADAFSVAQEAAANYYAYAYSYAGGILGCATDNALIFSSYNCGAVHTVTGVKLYANSDYKTYTDNYAYGGGILGYAEDAATVQGCYNVGFVTTDNTSKYSCRGIAGSSATVTNCYCLDHTPDTKATVCTAEEMAEQSTFAAFDFDSVWTMDGHPDYPYPELQDVEMIYAIVPTSLTVSQLPRKTVYRQGEEFDPAGLVVTARYNNGTADTTTDYTLSYDFSQWGDTTITVTCGEVNTSFTVCVESLSFSGGCGTAQHPFLIADSTQLDHVRDHLSAHFRLIADVALSPTDFPDSSGFSPIGTIAAPFTGTFDGEGHTISGLYQNISAQGIGYAGLFGCVEKATISDLGLVNADIRLNVTTSSSRGYAYAGGLVGRILEHYSIPTTITGCFFSGSVQDTSGSRISTEIGGLVGNGYNVTISNCYNLGTVSSIYGSCGGIIGYAEAMTIRYCYNAGTLTGSQLGGILGECSLDGQIHNCYNSGTLMGEGSHTGGIVGFAFMTINIHSCYNVGQSGNGEEMGGIAGYASEREMVTGCYYLDSAEAGILRGSSAEEDYSVRCTAAQLQQAITFTSFDFVSTWTMAGDSDYPYPELWGTHATPIILHGARTDAGIRVGLTMYGNAAEDPTLIMAVYDTNGKQQQVTVFTQRQLELAISPAGLELSLSGSGSCKLFLLDGSHRPLVRSVPISF